MSKKKNDDGDASKIEAPKETEPGLDKEKEKKPVTPKKGDKERQLRKMLKFKTENRSK